MISSVRTGHPPPSSCPDIVLALQHGAGALWGFHGGAGGWLSRARQERAVTHLLPPSVSPSTAWPIFSIPDFLDAECFLAHGEVCGCLAPSAALCWSSTACNLRGRCPIAVMSLVPVLEILSPHKKAGSCPMRDWRFA